MPDLLLELRSEEIPARMQRKAAGDLKKMVTDGLVEAGLTYEAATEYWTPRRLALDIRGVTARSKDVREEIKGPPTKAPEQAIQGFMRKTGLASIEDAQVQSDPKKGDFYVAVMEKPGRAAEEIVAEIMPGIIRDFPWPKSMRWGAASAKPGSLRWVRPLQSILCTFGPETEEPVVVDFEIDGIRAGNVTYGHRFHAPDAITVRRFEDYVAKLEAAKVVLDAERRKRIILDDARNLAFANGLELVDDEGLLEEVAGLVEWPVVLLGEFEPEFLDIPDEVIRLTIRANQKCFVCRPQGSDQLTNRFVVTANIEAIDGGKVIAHGNGKVVRARLSDAVHFWKTDQADLPDLGKLAGAAEKLGLDLKKPLDQRMARLEQLGVTFHAKLGTQGERVERIVRLAGEIAPLVGADPEQARRAALLAKADLQTEMVGEFPELQGAMGRKYAVLQGEDPAVAAAIEEHYRPLGPSDIVPTEPVSIAVALADKLDTLVGFWAIDEKPTGSKDPYALRRAALGVIRIILENEIRVPLRMLNMISYQKGLDTEIARIRDAIAASLDPDSPNEAEAVRRLVAAMRNAFHQARVVAEPKLGPYLRPDFVVEDGDHSYVIEIKSGLRSLLEINEQMARYAAAFSESTGRIQETSLYQKLGPSVSLAITGFVNDRFFSDVERLKQLLRDAGTRHDLIDAVLASGEASREAPPSALPGISPSRGEIGQMPASAPDRAPGDFSPAPAEASEPSERSAVSGMNDDLLLIVRRVEALGQLLETEDGRNLVAGTKRAANILGIEEKKGTAIAGAVDPALFRDSAETKLYEAVNQAESKAAQAIEKQDFSAAMVALAALREPVDSFFEEVLVNDEDEAVRANRLALLSRIRAATGQVADFSKIAG